MYMLEEGMCIDPLHRREQIVLRPTLTCRQMVWDSPTSGTSLGVLSQGGELAQCLVLGFLVRDDGDGDRDSVMQTIQVQSCLP